jgi:hypothetical protein
MMMMMMMIYNDKRCIDRDKIVSATNEKMRMRTNTE